MKNKVLIITVIAAASLIIGGSITVLAEETVPPEGRGNIIDRSIFEPFREKIEDLKLKRDESIANREQVMALHDELKAEAEEFRTNRDAFMENPEMLTEAQRSELRTILETLNAEGGARKTLISTRGTQVQRIESIRALRRSFRESPNDEDLDAIDALFDEIIDTQGLRIRLIPEALDLLKAANAIFDPTL